MRCIPLGEKLNNTAVALGQFEALHVGHCAVIRAAVRSGCSPAVLTFNRGTLKKGDDRELLTDDERLEGFEALGVETVIEADFEAIRGYSPERFVSEVLKDTLGASLVTCGRNYRFGAGASGDSRALKTLCANNGIAVKLARQASVNGVCISTSAVRACLDSGDVRMANAMLGRPFGYALIVVSGQKLGRTLGAPTINQLFPEGFICPKYGVYASFTEVDGRRYPSVTNIGVRPTVGSDEPLSETWICGLSEDLYGRKIRVSLLEYLREEKKFASLDELKNAIFADGKRAVEIFQCEKI